MDACASELLWEAGADRPPVDALRVAESLGLIVARDSRMSHRARFVELSGPGKPSPTIVIGPAERPEREQWALAHEIGESAAYRVFERLGIPLVDVASMDREAVANRLASALLLPIDWFRRDGCELQWDLLALKARYTTASHELVARRMLDLPEPIVITVFDLGRLFWRRSNRPGSVRMSTAETALWQHVHRRAMPADDFSDPESGLARIRCWPVHEPGWKREIMRSEIVEW